MTKSIIFFIAITALSLSSCKNALEDRLPGSWSYVNYETRTIEFNNSSSTELDTIKGSIVFTEEGTGTLTISGAATSFYWTNVEDSVYFTIDGKEIDYFVTDNSKDSQQWQATLIENGTDYKFTTEQEIVLAQ